MENLGWGLQMTVLGMGLVFALLALLWGLLTVILILDKEPKEETSEREVHVEAERIAADLVAAILVATMRHKSTLRRQAAPLTRTYWPGSQLFASRWVASGRSRQNYTWQPKGK
jgi:Na+-transporting methylmalonyl-CoA/oxaloacetate decarboxylase gamma subunit